MSDWRVGDLALCIRSRRDYMPVGSIHTVTAVFVSELGRTGLQFADAQPRAGALGFLADRFHKIRPHHPDAEDEETLRLLNGQPVRETV